MGAGKTYLMSVFIYLDLYFSLNEPNNKSFAHNFIILVPSGLKSSIMPSLKKIKDFDAVVAMIAAVFVCLFGVAEWKQIQENTDWGVLMLFGGGLSLSVILTQSGASKALVDSVQFLISDSSYFVIGVVVATFIIFLTEFTSNTASAALLVPIFISVAENMELNPLGLSLIIGLGASCAFMLPVATPPNAIAYGTGKVLQKDMVKAGFVLNILCIIFISLMAFSFWK